MLSIEISFFDASKSGPSHLQIQASTKLHFLVTPFGPSWMTTPENRFLPASQSLRSCHSCVPAKPFFKTRFGYLVRPMSLCVVSLTPPSATSTTSDSDFSPLTER